MRYDLKRIPRQSDTAGAALARLGSELRTARISLGYTIEDLAVALRIRRVHLAAIEEGRLAGLPGLAYALGFVRSYAEALGLDPQEMAHRFREAAGQASAKPKLDFPEPVADRRVPTAAVVTAGAVVAICTYVAWFNWSVGGNRMVDVVPPVPPRLEQAADRGLAQMPGQDRVASASPGALPLAALPPPGGLAPVASAPPSSGANTSAQAATVPTAALAPAATVVAPEPPPLAAPEPPPPPPPPFAGMPGVPEGTRIVLRARAGTVEGSWVQVRDPRTRQVLVNRVLRPSEIWAVPVREGLLLDTGKADALEILVDGEAQPTLEGLVGVRRNIALDPAGLRQPLVPPTAAATR